MSKFLKSKAREHRKIKVIRKLKKRLVFFNSIVLFVVGMVGVFYLIQINTIASQGYKVDDLKKQIGELQSRNQKLEIKTVELQSILNLENKVAELNMIRSDKVVHIDKTNYTVAVR